ncbi:hypothetical protein BGZ74_001890 [Mortierella antarctica]|nr:hypothetical protein BGZ74_001890 [Mortierella antarctica]
MRIGSLSILVLSAAIAAAQTPNPLPESLSNPDLHRTSKVSLAVSQPGCLHSPMGGNCPDSAPCCSSAGYCGSDPSFCAEACNAGGSFAPDSCWPLPMAVNIHDEFTDKNKMVDIRNFNGFPSTADWVIDRSAGSKPHAEITADQKLVLRLNRVEKHPTTGGGIGATVHSSRWMKYGTIEARLKTASNQPGPVSSFILISPISGDEIDFEIVGKDPTDMQTNFYYKVQPGRDVNYGFAEHINVDLDTSADYHTYKLEWTATEMKWYFDGLASAAAGNYPDTPMRVAFGLWDGGYGNPGTAEWAGKDTSYEPNEQREYQMWVDWVKINPQTPENSTDPWPGQKYLKQMEGGKNDNHGADGTGTGSGSGSGSGSGAGSGSGSGNGGSSSKSGAGQLVAQLAGMFVLATTVFTTLA